jgi:hypothetical protein
MKVFNIKVKGRNKDSIFQIAAENAHIDTIAYILDESSSVDMWALDGEKEKVIGFEKYSSGLAMHHKEAQTDKTIAESIVDAIKRVNNERIKKYDGCYVESFVGGPGDYSPPDCNCERCIAAGRSYRYQSFNIPVSKEMFLYFKTILNRSEGTKLRKWGIEHTVPGKALICLYDSQGNMSIRSNKNEIRLGVYVFNHTTRAWSSAP